MSNSDSVTKSISWSEIESNLDNLRHVDGGFTLAKRGLLTLEDGREIFVKIGINDKTKHWVKKEILAYKLLVDNNYQYAPRLLSYNDDETSLAIDAFLAKDGWDWSNNWTYARLDKTLEAIDALAAIQPQGDTAIRLSEKSWSSEDDGWSVLYKSVELQNNLHDKLEKINRLDLFDNIDFEKEQNRSLKYEFLNNTLVHNDIRADNCAWNSDTNEIKLVDWNWIQIGDRKIDQAAFLAHVYQHGLDLIPRYSNRLDAAAIHWCAGFWLNMASTPIWPGGSDSLRELQLLSGVAALDLLQSLSVH